MQRQQWSSESIQFAAFAHVLYYDVGKLHCAILYVHFFIVFVYDNPTN